VTSLRRIMEVARREILVRGRSKAYLLTTVLLALAMSVLAALPALLGGDDEEVVAGPALDVGIVGTPDPDVALALDLLGGVLGRELVLTDVDDLDAARLAVTAGELRLAVDATAPQPVVIAPPPGFLEEQDGLAAATAQILAHTSVLRGEGLDDEAIANTILVEPVEVASSSEGDAAEVGRRAAVAYGGLMFLYTTLLIFGTWVVNGVIEEKSSRVVEVLLSTLRPRDLLAGKVLGLGALGITQVLAVALPAVVVSAVVGDGLVPPGATPAVLGIVGWWILGFLLYASILAGTGSLLQRPEDAQSATFPVIVPIVGGLFLAIAALDDPHGLPAIIGSYVPLTAPMVMVVRTTLGEAAWWEMLLSALSILAGGIGATLLAGRIYAGAILRTRGKVKLRDAWRADLG